MNRQKIERTFASENQTGTLVSNETKPRYDEKLNRILAVAATEIARVGYDKASMRLVSKAAGVSLAGMYHYFDSKQRMLFLIQFRTFNSLLNGLLEQLQGVDDPLEQLQVMVRAHVGYFANNMEAVKVCSHELESLTGDAYDQMLRIRNQYYELTRGIIDRLLERHAPSSSFDPHVATMCLFGTLNWLYRWYHPKRDRSPTVVANQIVNQCLAGLLHEPVVPTNDNRGGARTSTIAPAARNTHPMDED